MVHSPCIHLVADLDWSIRELSGYFGFDMFYNAGTLFIYPTSTFGIRPHFHAKFGIVESSNYEECEDIHNLVTKYYNYEPLQEELSVKCVSYITWLIVECGITYQAACRINIMFPREYQRARIYISKMKPCDLYQGIDS